MSGVVIRTPIWVRATTLGDRRPTIGAIFRRCTKNRVPRRRPSIRQTRRMHFQVEHEFPAPRAKVADVLCDPAFQSQLDLPDLSRPQVVESSSDGTSRLLRLRYEYVGQVDGIARKIVGGRKLTWVQELRLDTATYTGTLSFSAEEDSGRVNGSADVAIITVDGDTTCRRRIAGDLHIRIPLVGGTAEKKVVPGLVRRLDVEAAALSQELATRG
jgi:hypothetical protein